MKRPLLGIAMGTTMEEELLVVVHAGAPSVVSLAATVLHAGAPRARCLCHVRLTCQRCQARHAWPSCFCPSTCLLPPMAWGLLPPSWHGLLLWHFRLRAYARDRRVDALVM